MNNWQKVYATTNPYQAEIVKGVLEAHALSAVILNKKDTSYHFGICEVYVSADDTIKALKVIGDEIKFE
jgi:transcription termination factor Rho